MAVTTTSSAVDELAHPRLPFPLRAFNALGAPLADRASLDPDDLVAAAREKAGLHDLGGDSFRQPFEVLCRAVQDEADLTPLGRLLARQQLSTPLLTRLRLAALEAARPEVAEERIEAPIIVAGLPRTGTTLLQRLLAQDPGLRSLPYWEAMEPIPDVPAGEPAPDPDPRIKRARQGLKVLHWAAPRMLAMHEMEAEAPDEELWLLSADFGSMLYEASWHVPSYVDWFVSHDQTPAYAYLARLLRALQWYRRADRWVLKSPQHLGQLGPLLATFPDATVVQTHRDPVKVTASVSAMIAYGRRSGSAHIDPRAIAATWADRIAWMLDRSTERAEGDDRFVDVHLADLQADPIGTARRVLAAAGRDLSPVAEQRMQRWLAANPRDKHGEHRYVPEELGLDPDRLRARFEAYTDRFQVT